MKSSPRWARAAWARSTARATPVSTARRDQGSAGPSRRNAPICASGSNAKRAAISSLNHPHICTLHDVGHQDGDRLPGHGVSRRRDAGAAAAERPAAAGAGRCNMRIQIADALDKAHRNGIIHRDLKPGNIMLTKSGRQAAGLRLGEARRSRLSMSAAALSRRCRPMRRH